MSDTATAGLHDVYDTEIEPLQEDSDFYTWKSQTTSHLCRLGFWAVVSGITSRPVASSSSGTTREQSTWDTTDTHAKHFLYRHIAASLTDFLAPHVTSTAIWNALMDRFHRNDAASLLRCHRTIYALHYSEDRGDTIPRHLALFERHWTELLDRTADADMPVVDAPNSLETTMALLARSEEAKTEILIASLPGWMRRLAGNLKIKSGGEMPYAHLWRLLMELYVLVQMDDREEAERQPVCSWCRSRGLESAGHIWSACERLTEFKSDQRRQRREKNQRKRRERKTGRVVPGVSE